MANTGSVFFKTFSKSIYTSNMIKGGGQGGLKCKKLLTPSICASGQAIMVYKFMLLLLFLWRSLGCKIVKWYVYMKVAGGKWGGGRGSYTFSSPISWVGGGGEVGKKFW